ncbi:hypothetical protein [Pseudomonas sp. NPDC089569]
MSCGVFEDAFAGKPGSYGFKAVLRQCGVFEGAFAGKPGSYRGR